MTYLNCSLYDKIDDLFRDEVCTISPENNVCLSQMEILNSKLLFPLMNIFFISIPEFLQNYDIEY